MPFGEPHMRIHPAVPAMGHTREAPVMPAMERHRRLERLVPRDAHPARIVIGLRVGALHRVAQAIGMVSSLKRGLRLRAAVPSRLERRLVALDFHRATVLHRHPYAAFHLAAASTRRAYPLDLRHGSLLARRRPERLRTL